MSFGWCIEVRNSVDHLPCYLSIAGLRRARADVVRGEDALLLVSLCETSYVAVPRWHESARSLVERRERRYGGLRSVGKELAGV